MVRLLDHSLDKLERELDAAIATDDFDTAVEASLETIQVAYNIDGGQYALSYPLVYANVHRIKLLLKETVLRPQTELSREEMELRRNDAVGILLELLSTMTLSLVLPTPGFSGMYKDAVFAKLFAKLEDLEEDIGGAVHLLTRITNGVTGVEITLVTQGTIWVSSVCTRCDHGRKPHQRPGMTATVVLS